jgi:hypothetical protein
LRLRIRGGKRIRQHPDNKEKKCNVELGAGHDQLISDSNHSGKEPGLLWLPGA